MMEVKMKRYKPEVDKLYVIICVISAVVTLVPLLFSLFYPEALFVTVPVTLLVAYFVISPFFGYVELREDTLFIRLGFILTREIPYTRIRGYNVARKLYSDSMVSLKLSVEHINVKYNVFDVISISVADSDDFIENLTARI